MARSASPASVTEYLAGLAPQSARVVRRIRGLVRKNVPGCREIISYGIPAFAGERIFMYCAAFKAHIGIYPPVRGDARLIQQLKPYANAKGNLRFALSAPMPYPLIVRVAKALAQSRAAKPVKKPAKQAEGARMAGRFKPQQGMVLFARNKRRVSKFYQQALGLKVVESAPSHDLLQAQGYEIVVHAIPRKIAAAITIATPPVPRTQAAIKPTFAVRSLEKVRTAVERTGGFLKPASAAWHLRGCTVLDGHDPEGNQVQFKQRDP
jgi:uncharacterized protein YdhG (YjbR/CyaY superfamily)/predicted enzyme related to lactoylglutathione lyase